MASTEFQNRVNALQDNDSNGINNELKQFFESAANRKLMRASSEKSAVSREHAITVAKEMQILDDAKKTALKNAIATLMNTLTATIDGQTKTCAEILAKDRTRASKQNIAELKQAAALVSLHYMIEKGKPLFYGKDAQDYAWQFCDNKPETTDTQTEPVKTEGKTVTPPSNTDTEKEPTQTPTAPEKTKEVVEAEKKVEEKNKALEKAKETAEKAKTDEEKKAAAEIVKKEKAALEEAEKAANTIKEKEATNTTPKEVVVDALPSSDVQKSVEDAMRLKNIEEFTKNTLTNLIPPTDGTFKFEKKELEKMKAGSQNIQKRLNEITDYNKLASSMNQIMQQIHDNASKGLIPSDVSIDPQSDSVKVVFDHSLSNKNNERPAWEEHIDRQYKAFTDRKKELDKPTYQQFINIAENLPTFEGLAPALTAYKEAQTAVRETEKTIAQKEEEAYRLIKENAEQRAILATVPETSTKDSDIAQRKQATEKLTENYIKLYGNRVVDQNLPGLGKTSGLSGEEGKNYVHNTLKKLGLTQSIQDELEGPDGQAGLYKTLADNKSLLEEKKAAYETALTTDQSLKTTAVQENINANATTNDKFAGENTAEKNRIDTELGNVQTDLGILLENRTERVNNKSFLTDPEGFAELQATIDVTSQKEKSLLNDQKNIFYRDNILKQQKAYAEQQKHEFAGSLAAAERNQIEEEIMKTDLLIQNANEKLKNLEKTHTTHKDSYTSVDNKFREKVVSEINAIKNTMLPELTKTREELVQKRKDNLPKINEIAEFVGISEQAIQTIQSDMNRFELQNTIEQNKKTIEENTNTIKDYQTEQTGLLAQKELEEISKSSKEAADPYADTAAENEKIAEINARLNYIKNEVIRLSDENMTLEKYNTDNKATLDKLTKTVEDNQKKDAELIKATEGNQFYTGELLQSENIPTAKLPSNVDTKGLSPNFENTLQKGDENEVTKIEYNNYEVGLKDAEISFIENAKDLQSLTLEYYEGETPLDLSGHNQLTELNLPAIKDMSGRPALPANIEKLDIESVGRSIEALPGNLNELANLKELNVDVIEDLSNQELPTSIEKLSIMAIRKIERLPQNINNLTNLKVLRIDKALAKHVNSILPNQDITVYIKPETTAIRQGKVTPANIIGDSPSKSSD